MFTSHLSQSHHLNQARWYPETKVRRSFENILPKKRNPKAPDTCPSLFPGNASPLQRTLSLVFVMFLREPLSVLYQVLGGSATTQDHDKTEGPWMGEWRSPRILWGRVTMTTFFTLIVFPGVVQPGSPELRLPGSVGLLRVAPGGPTHLPLATVRAQPCQLHGHLALISLRASNCFSCTSVSRPCPQGTLF